MPSPRRSQSLTAVARSLHLQPISPGVCRLIPHFFRGRYGRLLGPPPLFPLRHPHGSPPPRPHRRKQRPPGRRTLGAAATTERALPRRPRRHARYHRLRSLRSPRRRCLHYQLVAPHLGHPVVFLPLLHRLVQPLSLLHTPLLPPEGHLERPPWFSNALPMTTRVVHAARSGRCSPTFFGSRRRAEIAARRRVLRCRGARRQPWSGRTTLLGACRTGCRPVSRRQATWAGRTRSESKPLNRPLLRLYFVPRCAGHLTAPKPRKFETAGGVTLSQQLRYASWWRRQHTRQRHQKPLLPQPPNGPNHESRTTLFYRVADSPAVPSFTSSSDSPHLAHVVYRKQGFLSRVVREEADERTVLRYAQALFHRARNTPRPTMLREKTRGRPVRWTT